MKDPNKIIEEIEREEREKRFREYANWGTEVEEDEWE